MVCEEKNSTVMVDLRQRECTVCQPSLQEKLEVVDICDDVLTQDCQDDPLNPEPWTKFCDTDISKILNNGLTFEFEKSLPETLAVDLVKQSLVPINDLLADTLPFPSRPNIEEESVEATTLRVKTTSTAKPRSKIETTEDVSEILKILTQKQIESRDSDIFLFGEAVTATPDSRPVTRPGWPSLSSSSVYFDPVLNTRPLSSSFQDTTQSSLTEFLNFQLQKQFSTNAPAVENIATVSENQSSEFSSLITTTESSKDKSPRMSLVEIETAATTSAKTMTSSTVLTPTTTTTTSFISTAHPTTQKAHTSYETKESQSRVTLSPSEVLQLCFLNSSYCDFSQNEVLVSNSETTTTLTATPPTTATAKLEFAVTSESALLVAQQEDIKDKIRKCFLTGECGDADNSGSDYQKNSPTLATTPQSAQSVSAARSSATLSPRDSDLRRRVKARARACLFEGKCT